LKTDLPGGKTKFLEPMATCPKELFPALLQYLYYFYAFRNVTLC